MVQRKIVNRTVSLLLAGVLCGCCAAGVSAVAVDEQATVYPNDGYVEKDLRTGEETYIPQSSIPVPLSGETSQPAYEGLLGEQNPNVQLRPRAVIGNDQRWMVSNTTVFPYRAIACIRSYWPDGRITRGTGWLFHRDKMVTAGHNVYNKLYKGWAEKIMVRLGQTDYDPRDLEVGATWGTVYATRKATTTPWINSQDKNMDYALLELDSHIGVLTGWFGYGYNQTSLQTPVTVSGYPSEVNQSITYRQWAMSGNIILQTDNLLYYMIDTSEGQSGSPVYKQDNMAVGVHTYGESLNLAKRIHKDMYDWMQTF